MFGKSLVITHHPLLMTSHRFCIHRLTAAAAQVAYPALTALLSSIRHPLLAFRSRRTNTVPHLLINVRSAGLPVHTVRLFSFSFIPCGLYQSKTLSKQYPTRGWRARLMAVQFQLASETLSKSLCLSLRMVSGSHLLSETVHASRYFLLLQYTGRFWVST